MAGSENNTFKLVWDEKGNPREHVLSRDTETNIGRDKRGQIPLPDPQVSQKHSVITWARGGFTITDQKSSNGTFVNGKQIHAPTELHPGDQISIGSTIFHYVMVPAENVGDLKTKVYQRPTTGEFQKEADLPAETARDSISSMETKLFASAPPKMDESMVVRTKPEVNTVEQSEALPPVSDDLSTLLDQIELARKTAETLREQDEKNKSRLSGVIAGLNSIVSELEAAARQDSELEHRVLEGELMTLLDELSRKPSDVNLLIKLAANVELIGTLAKTASTHTKLVERIAQSLANELANLNRG